MTATSLLRKLYHSRPGTSIRPTICGQKMFDIVTRTVLQHYTVNPPSTEDHWYGPWTSILTTLFPTPQGYIVTPQRRIPEDSESHIPDFIIEVVRLISSPIQFSSRSSLLHQFASSCCTHCGHVKVYGFFLSSLQTITTIILASLMSCRPPAVFRVSSMSTICVRSTYEKTVKALELLPRTMAL